MASPRSFSRKRASTLLRYHTANGNTGNITNRTDSGNGNINGGRSAGMYILRSKFY
jgi:hypothetical protein